jgi:peroxiredoxin
MKYWKYFLLLPILAALVALTSYTVDTPGISEGTNKGNLLPALVLEEETGKKVDLSDLRGVKVLINFWAAYDAESHQKNCLYWHSIVEDRQPIVLVSVSFDKSRSVYEKTLQIDGLNSRYQFWDAAGEASPLYKYFRLNRQFNSYLVNENGVIIAVNPQPDQLSSLL